MYLPFFGWQNIFKEFLTLVFMKYKQTFLWRSETLSFCPCYYHQFFDRSTSPLCLNTCQKKEHFPKYFFIFKGFQPKIGYNNLEFRKFAQGSKRFMLIRTKWELLLLYSNYFSILFFYQLKVRLCRFELCEVIETEKVNRLLTINMISNEIP